LNVGPEAFVSLKTTSITNDYKFQEVLGEGAFGVVRLVKHKSTGLIRAMKIIDKSKLKELK
jgi:serine/threonine protein kinase